MKSIFKAVATITIFSVITRLLGFFFRIFISRKLGAEGMGLYQMAISVLGIFMTLVSSGIPLTTAKFVSKHITNNEYTKRNQVVSSALVIATAIACFCSITILILKHVWGIILTDNRAVEIMLTLIPSIIFSAIYAVFRGALWGQSDYFNCGLTELIEQIIRFVLTFILLLNISDCFIATKNSAIAFNLTCAISAIITIFIYFKTGKLSFNRGQYKNVLKSALPVTGVRLASSIVQPLTTMILPTMLVLSGYSSSEAVSSFGIIMGMTFPMLFVPMSVIGSISMVLIPSISSMMSKKEFSTINTNVSESLHVSIFISMLFVPLYLSVGDLIGIVLFNNSTSGILLQLSALCVLPITLCNLSGSILNALNLEVKSFTNYIIGSIVLFSGLILLTPLIGINSIILSFFASMSTISLLNIRKIKRTLPDFKFDLLKLCLKYILFAIPCGILGHFVSNICLHLVNEFLASVIGGSVSLISMLILCNTFNLYKIEQILSIVKRKRKT